MSQVNVTYLPPPVVTVTVNDTALLFTLRDDATAARDAAELAEAGAQSAQSAAELAQAGAETAEVNAGNAAIAAAASESNAQAEAAAALASENAASASAAAAAISENNADTSAAAALVSELNTAAAITNLLGSNNTWTGTNDFGAGVTATGDLSASRHVFAGNAAGNGYFRCYGQQDGVSGGKLVLNHHDNSTGAWSIYNAGKNLEIYQESAYSTSMCFKINFTAKNVELYSNNVKRLETYTTGAGGVDCIGDYRCNTRDLNLDQYRCRAAGYIGGIGTVSLTNQFGFTAVTDLGVGSYRLTLDHTIPANDGTMHVVLSAHDGVVALSGGFTRQSSNQINIFVFDSTGTGVDAIVHVMYFVNGGT